VGCVGVTDRCSFPIIGRGKEHESGAFHDLMYKGNLGALVVIGTHHEGPIGHKAWSAGQGSWPADRPFLPMARRLLQ
jgi:hypothetical protein